MSKKTIKRNSEVLGPSTLPNDCLYQITKFFNSGTDLVSLFLTVRGFYEYFIHFKLDSNKIVFILNGEILPREHRFPFVQNLKLQEVRSEKKEHYEESYHTFEGNCWNRNVRDIISDCNRNFPNLCNLKILLIDCMGSYYHDNGYTSADNFIFKLNELCPLLEELTFHPYHREPGDGSFNKAVTLQMDGMKFVESITIRYKCDMSGWGIVKISEFPPRLKRLYLSRMTFSETNCDIMQFSNSLECLEVWGTDLFRLCPQTITSSKFPNLKNLLLSPSYEQNAPNYYSSNFFLKDLSLESFNTMGFSKTRVQQGAVDWGSLTIREKLFFGGDIETLYKILRQSKIENLRILEIDLGGTREENQTFVVSSLNNLRKISFRHDGWSVSDDDFGVVKISKCPNLSFIQAKTILSEKILVEECPRVKEMEIMKEKVNNVILGRHVKVIFSDQKIELERLKLKKLNHIPEMNNLRSVKYLHLDCCHRNLFQESNHVFDLNNLFFGGIERLKIGICKRRKKYIWNEEEKKNHFELENMFLIRKFENAGNLRKIELNFFGGIELSECGIESFEGLPDYLEWVVRKMKKRYWLDQEHTLETYYGQFSRDLKSTIQENFTKV